MALPKQIKYLNNRDNGQEIIHQYTVPYSITSNNRYKHIDELKLIDGKIIKATMGPIDLSILPYNSLKTYIITSSDEHRIDLVATKLFGNASLYWVLCYLNNISDPLNLPIGTQLFYCDVASLKQYPNPLS